MNFFINTRPRIAHFPSSWRWNSSTHRRQIPGLDGSDETKWRSVMTIWDLYGGCKYIDQYYISTVSVYNIYIYIHTYVHIYIYIHIHILCVICIYIYIYIYPPTPAFAKAGAAPGTTGGGVEPAFVGLQRLNIFLATGNRHPAGTPGPDQWVLMGVQACRLPGLKPLKPLQRCKILLLRPTPQAQATPRPHQWLLMGVQACRLPGLKRLKPLQRCKIVLLRPTPQAQATPRPHLASCGVQACRCKIPLLRPTPQAQATPRPHQWLLMGVQACRLPGLKRLKPLQRCKIVLLRPTPQAQATPRPHLASCGVQACRCKIPLLRPTPQAQATPRPHQWLLMGVQACRLPGLKRLKPLQRCKILLLRPTPQAQATPTPHQWLLYGRSSLPFAPFARS